MIIAIMLRVVMRMTASQIAIAYGNVIREYHR